MRVILTSETLTNKTNSYEAVYHVQCHESNKQTNKQTKTITNTKDKFDIIPHLKVRYTPAFNVHWVMKIINGCSAVANNLLL